MAARFRALEGPALKTQRTLSGNSLVLERHIGEHIRTVLRLGSASIDPKTPLRSLGFDSLLSVELRTHLETNLSVGLDNDFVWTHPTR